MDGECLRALNVALVCGNFVLVKANFLLVDDKAFLLQKAENGCKVPLDWRGTESVNQPLRNTDAEGVCAAWSSAANRDWLVPCAPVSTSVTSAASRTVRVRGPT